MDRNSVFTKTVKGLNEATGKTSALSRDMRALLKEVDGKATVADVQAKLGKITEAKLLEAFQILSKGDYVREFAPVAKAAPAPPPPPPPQQKPAEAEMDLDFTVAIPTLSTIARQQAEETAKAQAQAAAAAAREKAEAEARAKAAAEAAARVRAEAEAKARALAAAAAAAKAKAEAEARAKAAAEEAARRAEAEARARAEAEEKARIAAAESAARARAEAEAKARREAEEKARFEAEEKARREAEERAKAQEQARIEAEARAQREAQERARVEAELKAKLEEERKAREEAERRAKEEAERERREAEERARREADELRAKLEEERRAREEAERRAKEEAERERREAEERARREADELRAKLEEERRAREEAERKAREAAERERKEAEEKARREADELRAKLDEERRAREEAERRAREEAERERAAAQEKAQREAEEARLRLEEERKAREEAERKAKEAAERERREAQEKAQREADELRARLEAETRARDEAERRMREEAERREREDAERAARAKAEAEARERAEREAREQAARLERETIELEARQRAERESREQAEREANERAVREAKEQAQREARELAERAARAAEETARNDADERSRLEAVELARKEQEEKARRETAAAAVAPVALGPSLEDLVKIETDFDAVLGVSGGAKQEPAKPAETATAKAPDELPDLTKVQIGQPAAAGAETAAVEKGEASTEPPKAGGSPPAADQPAEKAADLEREYVEERARLAAQQEETERHFAEMEKELAAEEAAGKQRKAPLEPRAGQGGRNTEEPPKPAFAEAAARTEPVAQAVSKDAPRYRKPINWGKPVALALFVMLALGLGAIHFVSFNGYIPQFEKTASEHLQQPVQIKSLRLALVPMPHWRMEGISIGGEGRFTAERIDAVPELGSMFGEKKAFKSIEIVSPVLGEAGLAALLFAKPSGQDLRVASISVKNGKLDSKTITLPVMDAKIALAEDGAWRKIALETPDRKTSLVLEPAAEGAQIEVDTNVFATPFGPAFILENFSAKGTVGRDQLKLSEFKGAIHGGYLSGSVNLKWGAEWSLSGEVSARAMDSGKAVSALFEDGALEGKAAYAMRARTYDELFAAPRLEGTFMVSKGTLVGVDLARLLQGGGIGGKTSFAELAGSFVREGGRTQLQQIRLSAGPVSVVGNADADARRNIAGRFAVELKSPVAQARANLALSGTLREPRFSK